MGRLAKHIPAALYGSRSICERCRKPMTLTYGSGRYCGSFCAHSHTAWNKGKKTGPNPAKVRGWVKRKLSPEYQSSKAKRAQTMRDMVARLHRDPIRMAARKAKTQATWANKKASEESNGG